LQQRRCVSKRRWDQAEMKTKRTRVFQILQHGKPRFWSFQMTKKS
jgi:hypothetical protein